VRWGSGLDDRRGARWSWWAAGLYALLLVPYVIVRHLRFNSGGFDLAIQAQVVWNTFHGRPFASSIEVFHYLGDHVSPLLALLAPLYLLWESPVALLVFQTLTLATVGPAAYRLARLEGLDPARSLLFSGVVLALPALGFLNRYDVHVLALAFPLLLWGIVWALERRLWWSRTALLAALAAREEVGLVVGVLALVLWARRRWGREALAWAAGSWAWSLVALFVLLPHFRDGVPSDTLRRYAYLGSSPGEMLETLVTRPLWVLRFLFGKEVRWLYLIQLLLPFAGRPLLAPLLLLPLLPALGHHLLSTNLSQVSIYFQYTATLLPFLVWAAAASLRHAPPRTVWVVVAATLAANVVDPALLARVGFPYAEVHGWERWVDAAAVRRLAAEIPAEASVAASDAFAPHLAHRRRLWVYRCVRETPPVDWILVRVTNRRDREDPARTAADMARKVAEGSYGVRGFADETVLLARGMADRPEARSAFARFLREGWGLALEPEGSTP
jgi:uncharacterized membrane protein